MTNKPDPIDVHVGSRVRARRALLGMSQTKLGNALGVTFQQIQKYERGANRMGSSRLYRTAQILGVPVRYFFEDLPGDIQASTSALADKGAEQTEPDQLTKAETLQLVRAYYKIEDETLRRKVRELVKTLAKAG